MNHFCSIPFHKILVRSLTYQDEHPERFLHKEL